MKPVYIPKSPHEKALQRALIQYRKPENHPLVREALERAGRQDLIGYGPKCLIRPVPPHGVREGKHASVGSGRKGPRTSSGRTGGGKMSFGNGRGSANGGGPAHGKRGSQAAGRNRAGQGREANRGGHRG